MKKKRGKKENALFPTSNWFVKHINKNTIYYKKGFKNSISSITWIHNWSFEKNKTLPVNQIPDKRVVHQLYKHLTLLVSADGFIVVPSLHLFDPRLQTLSIVHHSNKEKWSVTQICGELVNIYQGILIDFNVAAINVKS